MAGLDELLQLSYAAGSRVSWAQAAGGNSSVKHSGQLYVKASGYRLKDMAAGQGWVALDIKAARQVLDDPRYDALPHAQQQDQAGKEILKALSPASPQGRPSLEAEFHLLGSEVCLHVHLVEALAGLSLKEGKAWFAAALQGSGLVWAWVDYRPPGHALAKLVQEALAQQPGCQLVLMKNHGVIAYANSVQEALSLVEHLQRACRAALGSLEAPAWESTWEAGVEGPLLAAAIGPQACWKLSKLPWVASLALREAPAWQPLCPDDAIYVGLDLPRQQHFDANVAKGLKAVALALEGKGLLLAAQDARALAFLEEQLWANAQASALARRAGACQPLSAQQCEALLGMEGEKYRQERG